MDIRRFESDVYTDKVPKVHILVRIIMGSNVNCYKMDESLSAGDNMEQVDSEVWGSAINHGFSIFG